ncbi:MAG: gliding motility-associated C-terminal domain-containing protein [Chitinophagaceae bacterium]|nr:gliding motility-associated C-terminal domain-containing protein [Chitinophagaceae bacterium]
MFCILLIFFSCTADAQNCPQNIDFETGTFNGWTCYTGETDAINGENVISLYPSAGPVYNKHTMYNAGNMDTDPFGNFPVLCPNGSSHSVKLGSTEAGGQAEGISYEFTIPSNQNSYSITYHYAVVFQSPNHQSYEQPRMETEVFNVTDNSVISCASFSFIAIGTSIPGFEVSNLSDTINVLYKNWSAVSVDLSGNAGKTIRLFFKTADCTFRRHFGYAYIDINSECSGNITGATYCPDDTLVNLLAPYGFQSYAWYDSSVTEVMGTSQVLTLSPPPVSGTTFAVKLVPYDGYGCASTLFCRVTDSLTVTADAGKDGLSCNGTTLQIGTNPKAGLIYQWHPSEGLSNPYSANPFVTPVVTSNYVVVTTNSGGGCRTEDTVRVVASFIDASMQLIGKDAYCFGHGDSAVLQVRPVLLIDWFKDDIAINGTANLTRYRPTVSGTYHAVLANEDGCKVGTQKTAVTIDHDQAGITYPFRYAIENIPLRLAARPIGQTVLWNPAINLNDPESFNPEFTGDRDQLYHIVITSRGGCVTTDTQLVRAIKHVEIYVPTAFSPNGDGKNDYLHPVFRGISEVRKFCVFNRRGELCYQSSTELPGWDGNYKGVPQDPQTVVWLLECVGLDGVIYAQRGSSVLLR